MVAIVPGDRMETMDIWISVEWKLASRTKSDGKRPQRERTEAIGKNGYNDGPWGLSSEI